MERINEKHLTNLGFTKRAGMFMGYGVSIQQGKKGNLTLWSVTKGMNKSKDCRFKDELIEYLESISEQFYNR